MKEKSKRIAYALILSIVLLFFFYQELSWQGMRLSIDTISGADELIVLDEKSYRHGK
jgi:hypothetical protein